jgi:hypothetical protein
MARTYRETLMTDVHQQARNAAADWRNNVVETDTGCLVWQGRIDANGYSRIGGNWGHRAVYVIEVGPIPDKHDLDHTCTNPPCVNPAHLEPVTRAEHIRRTMQRAGADDRHVSAAYLRSLGLTYGDIAEVVGYENKSGAFSGVKAAIAKGLVDPDDVPRRETLEQGDRDEIMMLRRLGVPVREIAKWYGVHESQISRVSRGVTSGWQKAS